MAVPETNGRKSAWEKTRMRRETAAALLVLVSTGLAVLPVHGQGRVESVLDHLSRDAPLEITAPGLWLSDVTLGSLQADSVEILSHGAVIPVAYSEIETIAVRKGRGVSGALLGGGSGLLAGGLFGGMLRSFGLRTLPRAPARSARERWSEGSWGRRSARPSGSGSDRRRRAGRGSFPDPCAVTSHGPSPSFWRWPSSRSGRWACRPPDRLKTRPGPRPSAASSSTA